ncbi:hypothetical protein [Pedobacter gandavensis]|uniref:hypothetical protein n=1 Tax=Pedobacter gandavensis TaxID=2679963 RepID=UPI002931D65A|nr:hypothetical protein [Pedobacter gandavensis]
MSDNERNILVRVTTDTESVASGVAQVNNELGKIQVPVEQAKSFKAQLKEAREQAMALAQAGRQNTQEYQNAVATIAELIDQQDVLNREITAMDAGNKFQGLAKVAGLGASAIGGMTGALTLFGVSAENANESIAKLQSIQAIIGLIDVWGDSIDILTPFLTRIGLITVATSEQIAVQEAQISVTNANNVATLAHNELIASNIALENARIAVQTALQEVQSAGISGADELNDAESAYADALHARDVATQRVTTATQGVNTATTSQTAQTNALTTATEANVVATNTGSKALKGLKMGLSALGIGLIITAITMLVTNFDAIKEAVLKFIPGLKMVGDFFTKIVNTVTDFVGITSDATRELDRFTEASKRSNEMMGYQIQRLEAMGGKETEIYELKKKRTNNELEMLRKKLAVEGKLNVEEYKQFKELKIKKEVEDLKEVKRLDDNAKKEQEKLKAKNDKAVATAKALADKAKTARDAENKTLKDNLTSAQKVIDDSTRTALEKSENDIKLKYQKEIELAEKNKQSTIELEKAKEIELSAVRVKSLEESAKKLKETEDRLKKEADDNFKASTDADVLNAENGNIVNEGDTPEVATQKIFNIEDAKLTATRETFERKKLELAGQNEQLKLLQAQFDTEVTMIENDGAEKRKKIAESEAEAKQAIRNNELDVLGQFGGVLKQLGEKNKALTIAGIIAEQASSIGKIVMNTNIANAKAIASSPLTLGQPFVTLNTVSAGLGIASSLMAGRKAIADIGGSGGASSAGSAMSSITNASAPTITSSQTNRSESTQDVRVVNNPASAVSEQPTLIKAYISNNDLESERAKSTFLNSINKF